MTKAARHPTRRAFSALVGAGLFTSALPGRINAAEDTPTILVDGHVHITNRIYWEKIDPWQPQQRGWDFAQARASGVNCILENIGTHGYWNYNYTPKQALRLIETIHAVAERNADKMAIALSPAEARRIINSGRMAVFLGCEAGWDMDGDIDVLGAFYRLGLRTVQFATQTGFNAFADSAAAQLNGQLPDHYGGINARGRSLVEKMNELGVLIDITHATEKAQRQIIDASRAPVVASHETLSAVSGVGVSDEMLKAIAAKGGLVGIHGAAAVVGRRYRKWLAENVDKAKQSSTAVLAMLSHQASSARAPGDRGEFTAQFDAETERLVRSAAQFEEFEDAIPFIPTADEWAEHAAHVIKTVGADHLAIGLDLTSGRSSVPATAAGYADLLAALKKITSAENVRKIAGENWLRVLGEAKVS